MAEGEPADLTDAEVEGIGATVTGCDAVSPAYTPCQREADHDGPHRGRTAAGDVAEWPDDARSSADIRRHVDDT